MLAMTSAPLGLWSPFKDGANKVISSWQGTQIPRSANKRKQKQCSLKKGHAKLRKVAYASSGQAWIRDEMPLIRAYTFEAQSSQVMPLTYYSWFRCILPKLSHNDLTTPLGV